MGEDIIVFNPDRPMVYDGVLSKLASFQLRTIAVSVILIYICRDILPLVLVITFLGAGSILFSVFFRRYPVQVLINKKTGFLKAYYWDCFGNMKSTLINVEKAIITYRRSNWSFSSADRVLLVYDNIFNNWIKIDKTHGFTKEQLDTMFELLSGLHEK